jgi:hypothetical protein
MRDLHQPPQFDIGLVTNLHNNHSSRVFIYHERPKLLRYLSRGRPREKQNQDEDAFYGFLHTNSVDQFSLAQARLAVFPELNRIHTADVGVE